jgi:hypothetical protein
VFDPRASSATNPVLLWTRFIVTRRYNRKSLLILKRRDERTNHRVLFSDVSQ